MMRRMRRLAWLGLALLVGVPAGFTAVAVTASSVLAAPASSSSGGGDPFAQLTSKANEVDAGLGTLAIPAFTILLGVVAFKIARNHRDAWAWAGMFVVGVVMFMKRAAILGWLQN